MATGTMTTRTRARTTVAMVVVMLVVMIPHETCAFCPDKSMGQPATGAKLVNDCIACLTNSAVCRLTHALRVGCDAGIAGLAGTLVSRMRHEFVCGRVGGWVDDCSGHWRHVCCGNSNSLTQSAHAHTHV